MVYMDIPMDIHIWISIYGYPYMDIYRGTTFRYLQWISFSRWGYLFLISRFNLTISISIYGYPWGYPCAIADIFSGYPFREGDIWSGYLGSI